MGLYDFSERMTQEERAAYERERQERKRQEDARKKYHEAVLNGMRELKTRASNNEIWTSTSIEGLVDGLIGYLQKRLPSMVDYDLHSRISFIEEIGNAILRDDVKGLEGLLSEDRIKEYNKTGWFSSKRVYDICRPYQDFWKKRKEEFSKNLTLHGLGMFGVVDIMTDYAEYSPPEEKKEAPRESKRM